MAGGQILSGRILAKSLLPEPKTSLKCPLGALVLVTNQKFRTKKFTFSPLFRGSLWKLIGESGRERGLPRRAAGRAHPRGMADGWRVRKCHFRGLKHLRAVKIFPLTRDEPANPLCPAYPRSALKIFVWLRLYSDPGV